MPFYKKALQQFLKASTELTFLVSRNGRIQYFNPSALQALKSDQGQEEIPMILNLMPKLNMKKWGELWEQIAIEEQYPFTSEFMNTDGDFFPVEAKGMLLNVDGEETCLLVARNTVELNRYKNLLDLTSNVAKIGHWEWDFIQKKISISDSAYQLMGLSPTDEEIDSDTVSNFLQKKISPEKLHTFYQNSWLKAFKTGIPNHSELSFNIQGKVRQFHLHIEPVQAEGRTINMYGTIQDIEAITDRSDQMYLALTSFEKSSDMIFWVDEQGTFINVNEACSFHSQYTKEALLEMKVFDLEETYDETRWKQFTSKIKTNKSLPIEGFHKGKDGKKYPVEGHAIYIEHKGQIYICAILRNTAKRLERIRRLTTATYTIEHAMEQIIWLNAAGNIVYCNKRFCEVMEYSEEESHQLNIQDINPSIDKAEWQAHWNVLKKEKSQDITTIQITKSGKKMDVLVSANYYNLEGQEINCAFIKDISTRIQKERELEAAFREIETLKNQVEQDRAYLIEEAKLKNNFGEIISGSSAYAKVLADIEQVATTDATVLILGETGTGKELLARAIHELSNRSNKPLVKVNCATLAAELIESELFGHEKGSFTGAFRQKIGRFETAHNGTIFLDEIGELPIDLQPKLLRVLQEGEFQRIGGNKTFTIDTRIIAATNRDLATLVEEGKFREDLYYRLNVFPIINIPLRERKEDVPMLLEFFLKKYQEKTGKAALKITKGDMERLMNYTFPGNVRELENIVERAVILSKSGGTLNLKSVLNLAKKERKATNTTFMSMEEMTKQHILDALKRCNWKVTGKRSAAELLQMNGQTLYSRMRKYGLLEYLK